MAPIAVTTLFSETSTFDSIIASTDRERWPARRRLPWKMTAVEAKDWWLEDIRNRNDHSVDYDRVGLRQMKAGQRATFVIMAVIVLALVLLLIGHLVYEYKAKRFRSRRAEYITALQRMARVRRVLFRMRRKADRRALAQAANQQQQSQQTTTSHHENTVDHLSRKVTRMSVLFSKNKDRRKKSAPPIVRREMSRDTETSSVDAEEREHELLLELEALNEEHLKILFEHAFRNNTRRYSLIGALQAFSM